MSETAAEKEAETLEPELQGWKSGLGLRMKAKIFVKQHLDGARKAIEDSIHTIGDKIGTLQSHGAVVEVIKSSAEADNDTEASSEEHVAVVNQAEKIPASQGPDATQDTSGAEILGPLSRDVHERFEGAKKIFKSSFASIGDTAGSLLRFNSLPAVSHDSKDDTESEEISVAPIPPSSPRHDDLSNTTVATEDEGSGQKNVWSPLKKAIDGIVQPSQQIGKHLIQVWDLHDLVDDLKEQRNLWRQRRLKDSKDIEAGSEGPTSNEGSAPAEAGVTELAAEGRDATENPEQEKPGESLERKKVFLL